MGLHNRGYVHAHARDLAECHARRAWDDANSCDKRVHAHTRVICPRAMRKELGMLRTHATSVCAERLHRGTNRTHNFDSSGVKRGVKRAWNRGEAGVKRGESPFRAAMRRCLCIVKRMVFAHQEAVQPGPEYPLYNTNSGCDEKRGNHLSRILRAGLEGGSRILRPGGGGGAHTSCECETFTHTSWE